MLSSQFQRPMICKPGSAQSNYGKIPTGTKNRVIPKSRAAQPIGSNIINKERKIILNKSLFLYPVPNQIWDQIRNIPSNGKDP